MKTVLKISMFALLLVMSTVVFAQGNGRGMEGFKKRSPEARAKRMTKWMTKNLELSDEQSSKVKEINYKYAQKHHKNIETYHKNRQKARGERKKLEKQRDAEMKDVLTDSQYTTYQEKKKEVRQKMKQRRQNRRPRMGEGRGGAKPSNEEKIEELEEILFLEGGI